MWCPNCGTRDLSLEDRQCPVCNVALPPTSPAPAPSAPPPRPAADPTERRARLTFRFESLLTMGALLEAREVAREAAQEETDPAQRAMWAERQASLTPRIRRELRVRVVECQGSVPMPDLLAGASILPSAPCWISPSGQRLHLVVAYGRWVFIRVYDLAERRVRTLVSLHAPEPLVHPSAVAEEDTLWLLDAAGRLLELSTSTWDVRSWRPAGGLCAPGEELQGVAFTPSTRTLWARGSDGSLEKVRRLRLDERGAVPTPVEDDAEAVSLLPGAPGLRILLTDLCDARVYSAEGELLQEVEDDYDVTHCAAAPEGEGLLMVASVDGQMHSLLGLVQVAPDGTCGPKVPLEGSSSFRPSSLVTSSEARLGYLHFHGRVLDPWLAAFALTPRGPEQVFRIPVEHQVTLAQDLFARRVVLLTPTDEDTAVLPLGREAPRVSGAEKAESRTPAVAGYTVCWCGLPEVPDRMATVARSIIQREPEEARELALGIALSQYEAQPDELLALGYALEERLHADLGARVARLAWERHAGTPAVELHHAGAEAGAGQWSAALARLQRIDPSALDRRQTCHLRHLLGLAHYNLGRPDQALAELRRGLPLDEENACKLKQWIDLVSGVMEPDPLAALGPDQPYLQQLVGAIRAADDFLARGEAVRAARVLDRWAVWRSDDLQAVARLAQAWLLRNPTSEVERFRKMLVLAAFAHRQGARFRGFKLELPQDTAWTEERFARIAQQAREWLEQVG